MEPADWNHSNSDCHIGFFWGSNSSKIRIDREILRKNRYHQGDSSGNADCPHIGIGYKLVFAVEATA